MPLFLKIYLILSAVSIVVLAVGHAKENEKLDVAGLFIALAVGAVLGIGFAMIDRSSVSGVYVYKVNGVVVSNVIINVMQAFMIGLMGGAVPNLIGMGIGNGIRKAAERRASGDKSISALGKVGCIFFLIEGAYGIISGVKQSFNESAESYFAVSFIIVGLIFLLPGLLLLRKWRKSKK